MGFFDRAPAKSMLTAMDRTRAFYGSGFTECVLRLFDDFWGHYILDLKKLVCLFNKYINAVSSASYDI